MKEKRTALFIARTAIIAALYFVLTFFLQPISYGPVQFRVAEALTILPIFFIEAIPGLTIGCLLANIFSPFGWYDMTFGTMATLIASVLTRLIWQSMKMRRERDKLLFALMPPVVVNALILPLIWLIFASDIMFFFNMGMITLTQTAVIYLLGIPLYYGIKKSKIVTNIILM